MGINIMRLRPLHVRVLAKQQEGAHKTASGIVIPDAASEQHGQREVSAVGAGEILKNGTVRPLDVKSSGQAVKVGGEELLAMQEEDIIAVL